MTPRGWLFFALSSVIWGVPYLFIKVAVDAGLVLILSGSWLSAGGVREELA